MSNPFKVKRRAPIKPGFPPAKSRVYKKVSGNQLGRLIKRARAITRQLDEVKPLYNELDEITFALINVREGLAKHGVTIVDRFADKNTAFKTVGIRRFELSWVRS